MNTRSTFTKLLALIVAISMVMSVASVAMADTSQSHTHVQYYQYSGSSSYFDSEEISLTDGSTTSMSMTITPPTPPSRTGYSFNGYNVYSGSKSGTLLKSNVQAGASTAFTITRNNKNTSWPYIYVVGQWTQTYVGSTLDHIDVEIAASVRVIAKQDGVVTSDQTYSATVENVTGSLNGAARSFYPYNSYEYRSDANFVHQPTNVVTLTVTLKVNLGGGQYRTMTVIQDFTGSALDAAIALCPGSGTSKGYDIEISVNEISEMFTHEVEFLNTTGGSLTGTTDFEGILDGSAWSSYVTVPGTNPDNGYVFDGWYDSSNNKVTSFPSAITSDLTYTAKWTPLADVVENYYTVSYKLDGSTVTYSGYTANNATTMPTTVAPDASQPGYDFAGWYKQGASTKLNALTAGLYTLDHSDVTPAGPGTAKIIKNYYTLTLVGTLTKNTSTRTYYSVTYTSKPADATNWPANVVEVTTAPTIAAAPSRPGYTFNGWNPASLNWGSVTGTTGAEFLEGNTWITPIYKSITVSGSFTKKTGTLTYYSVIYAGDKATATTWPSDVNNVTTPPTIAADSTATKNGYTFDGWNSASLDWSSVTGTNGQEYYDLATDTYITPVSKTITVYGYFTQVAETVNKYYTVIYKADLNHDGTAETVTMSGFSVSEVTTMPTGVAGAPAVDNGYTFGGWNKTAPLTQADFGSPVFEGVANSTTPGVGNVRTIKYSLTITGSITRNETSENVYTVNYSVNNATGATVGSYQATQTGSSPFNAQSLPTVSSGYSITGWNIGGTNYTTTLPWPSTCTSSNESLERVNGVWTFVTYNYFTLNAAATVSENTHGTASEYNLSYSISGAYTDPTNGSTLSATGVPGNVTGASSEPTLGGSPAMKGHSFNGWKQGVNAIVSIDDIVWVESHRTDLDTEHNCFVDVTIYTASLTGTFTMKTGAENQWALNYQVTGSYTDFEGNPLSVTNIPSNVPASTSKPSLAGAPSLDGHSFNGWKQGGTAVTDATLNWGTAASSYRYNGSSDTFIAISTYTANVTGDFTRNTLVENKYYSLSYSISGTYTKADGTTLTPTAPSPVTDSLNSMPTLVDGNALDGHTFAGWQQNSVPVLVGGTPAYSQVGTTAYTLNGENHYVATSYYEAAVVGTYNYNGLDEKFFWNLTYTGDSALADAGTWPANLSGETSEPSITSLVPAKTGYTFSGWMQGGSVVSSISWTPEVQYTLNPTNNQYVKTTTYSATLEGALTKNGSRTEYIYVVDYTVTGGTGDYSGLDVNVTDPATLPVIAANPTEADKVFGGWNPDSLDWDTVTPVVVNDVRYDSDLGLWVNTSTKTINVTGSFTDVTHVNVYELTFTGPDGTVLPAVKSGNGSANAPTIDGETATLANHRFLGWSPAGITLSDYTEDTSRMTTSADLLTVTHYFEASTEAQFIQTANADSYTLHYNLTSSVSGQPANPADAGPSGSPITPDNGNVPATVGNYYFTGWTIDGWVKVGEQTQTVEGVEITTTYYEATATGFYTDMEMAEKTVYTLVYQGYVNGMLFWPADVIESETQPVVGGTPYLAGYTFNGWTPSSIDWSAATVTTDFTVIYPEDGDPYILKTFINTVRVTASFTQDEIPLNPPTEEEIPLGSPNTGSETLLGIAAVLAIIGTAIAVVTVNHRRRNEAEDGE